MSKWIRIALTLSFMVGCGAPELDHSGPMAEWREYAGDKAGLHYSPLTQIDRENVSHLELAWEHRSGDAHPGSADRAPTGFQVTPLVANGSLYYCTPFMRVFALDPETGEEKWMFDPELRAKGTGGPYPLTCRGVAYWEASDGDPEQACARRILYGTKDSELIALDADTGEPCADFGSGGRVALREGIGEAPPWEYYPTSPPLVMGDRVILGALVADQLRTDAPSGVVRAFDVRTGERLWAWDPVPPGYAFEARPGELYARGTPNVWSLLSGDEERGIVFVPTGNPSPDSYGGAAQRHRPLRQLHGRARRRDRPPCAVALPVRPPRRLGLRRSGPSRRSSRSRWRRRGGAPGRRPAARRWGTSSCSTARRASRCTRSRSAPFPRRRTCPARRCRPDAALPDAPAAAAPHRGDPRATPGASRRSTRADVPSRRSRRFRSEGIVHAAERSRARIQYPGQRRAG